MFMRFMEECFFQGYFKLIYYSKNKNKIIKKFFPIKKRQPYTSFIERDNFWMDQGISYFSFTFNDTIYQLTPDNLIPKTTFDFGENAFPNEILKKDFRDVREFMEYCQSTPYAYKIANHYFTEDVNLLTYEYKGNRCFGVYRDKNSKTLTFNDETKNRDDLYYFLKYPRGAGKEAFYFEIEPSKLLSKVKSLKEGMGRSEWKSFQKNNKKIFELIDHLSIDDPNLIVRAKMNPFESN